MVNLQNDMNKLQLALGYLTQEMHKNRIPSSSDSDLFMAYRTIRELYAEKNSEFEQFEAQLEAEYAAIEDGLGEGQVANVVC